MLTWIYNVVSDGRITYFTCNSSLALCIVEGRTSRSLETLSIFGIADSSSVVQDKKFQDQGPTQFDFEEQDPTAERETVLDAHHYIL